MHLADCVLLPVYVVLSTYAFGVLSMYHASEGRAALLLLTICLCDSCFDNQSYEHQDRPDLRRRVPPPVRHQGGDSVPGGGPEVVVAWLLD